MSEVLKEIKKEAKKMVTPHLPENIHPSMIAAHAQKVKNASRRIEDLKLSLAAEVYKKGLYILVVGDLAEDYAKEAEIITGSPFYSLDSVYDRLANSVDSANYLGRSLSLNTIEMLNSEVANIGNELGFVESLPSLSLRPEWVRTVNSKEEFKNIVVEMVGILGAELAALLGAKNMTDYVIKEEFDGKKIPIMLYSKNTGSAKLKKGLAKLGQGSFLVYAGEGSDVDGVDTAIASVNKTNVTKTLKTIKNKIKEEK